MRIAQAEHHCFLAFHLGAIADADNLQLPRPSLGYAFHGIIDQGTSQTVQSRLVVIFPLRHQVSVFLLHLDARRQLRFQLALRPLYRHQIPLDIYLHFLGNQDRLFSNSRHIPLSETAFGFPPAFWLLTITFATSGTGPKNPPVAGRGRSYQTSHRISPPTPSLRAWRPVMTPRGVVRMLIPMPPSTRGISLRRTYTRHPGLDTRARLEMAASSLLLYFK